MRSTNTSYNLPAKVFNALAHPSRLEILELLRDGEACVCHIQAMLDLRQAYISQHLNVFAADWCPVVRMAMVDTRQRWLCFWIDGMKTLQVTGQW
jgi:DNA-binding transcriptional ArsR family regulator